MTFKHQPTVSPITWIVVADRQRARILELDPERPDKLCEVDALEHPEGAAHRQEVETSRQGYFKGGSAAATSGDPKVDFPHQTAGAFCGQIVKVLDRGRLENRFGHLTIVAAPMFLGVLRSKLTDPLNRMISRTLDKDYTQLPDAELLTHFQE